MACKRASDQLSFYGQSDDDEGELSDDEQWSQPRTSLSHYRQSTILDLPLKRQRIVDTAVRKPNQQEISYNQLPQSSFRHSRTIIHIDIDCFYAQVEMVRNPQLREVPLGIQQKNIVVTCNYVARKHGVKKLIFVSDAKEKCPDLVLVNGEDLTTYREFSAKVHALLTREFTPLAERLGMDENFLDVSQLVKSRLQDASSERLKLCGFKYGRSECTNTVKSMSPCSCGCHERLVVGSVIAKEIRDAIFQETGLTSCAGVSHCKLLAKLVGGYKKPNEQTTIFPEDAEELLAGLQARDIPGIGHSIAKRLRTMNISSVPEVRSCPQKLLEDEFGSLFALAMIKWCHGVDDSEVMPSGDYKSISDEDSFKKCSTFQDVKNRLNNLIEGLLPRITDDVGMPRTIRLTVRRYVPHSHKRESRQCSLPHSFAISNQEQKATFLLVVCMDLFSKVIDVHRPFHLTLLGVSLTNFQKSIKFHSKTITSFFRKKTAKSQESANLSHYDISPEYLQHGGEDTVEAKFISHNNLPGGMSERCVAGCEHVVLAAEHSGTQGSKEMEKDKDQKPIQGHDYTLLNCPDSVDPTVFSELPLDIQQDLQAHWKKTGKNEAHYKKRNPKMTTGISRYFSRM